MGFIFCFIFISPTKNEDCVVVLLLEQQSVVIAITPWVIITVWRRYQPFVHRNERPAQNPMDIIGPFTRQDTTRNLWVPFLCVCMYVLLPSRGSVIYNNNAALKGEECIVLFISLTADKTSLINIRGFPKQKWRNHWWRTYFPSWSRGMLFQPINHWSKKLSMNVHARVRKYVFLKMALLFGVLFFGSFKYP